MRRRRNAAGTPGCGGKEILAARGAECQRACERARPRRRARLRVCVRVHAHSFGVHVRVVCSRCVRSWSLADGPFSSRGRSPARAAPADATWRYAHARACAHAPIRAHNVQSGAMAVAGQQGVGGAASFLRMSHSRTACPCCMRGTTHRFDRTLMRMLARMRVHVHARVHTPPLFPHTRTRTRTGTT